MQKKHKRLTACVVAAMLGLSYMIFPVHAEEVQSGRQVDTGELLELDETAVPVEESTEPEATPTPETDETVTVPEEQTENEEDKEEFISEPVEMEQETQPEAMEQTGGEAKLQGQMEITNTLSSARANTILKVETNDGKYSQDSNGITITDNGYYRITGNNKQTTERIVVNGNLPKVYIELDNVNLTNKKNDGSFIEQAPITIESSSDVWLILVGTNNLKVDANWQVGPAGIQFATEGDITYGVEGSLYITTKSDENDSKIYGSLNIDINGGGAGIGGYKAPSNFSPKRNASNIFIQDGNISITQHSDGAAGIGGGGGHMSSPGDANHIYLLGGTVTISSETYCIGGYHDNKERQFVIKGGSVKLTSPSGKDAITSQPRNLEHYGDYVYIAKLPDVYDEEVGYVKYGTDDNWSISPIHGSHGNEKSLYIYLSGKSQNIQLLRKDSTTVIKEYKAIWNEDTKSFTVKKAVSAPEITIADTTASSITVKELKNKDIYGEAEYKINDREWQDSNVFENLHSSGYGGNNYTVYARYKGNDTYATSEAGKKETVSTNAASYTISITANPDSPLVAGKEGSSSTISVAQEQPFDLGYNGQVDVKVKNDGKVTDKAELNLTRQNDTENHKITSALLVNGKALGNINTGIVTFKAKNDNPVTVSFAKPTEMDIPAGTYNGTITFEVSYSEQ